MAVNINKTCYCCSNLPRRMDIDAALDELGMLSTVTESRKQYLSERNRTRSDSSLVSNYQSNPVSLSSSTPSNPNAYHILHIDRNYVTGFSDSVKNDDVKFNTVVVPSNKLENDDVFLDERKNFANPPECLETSIELKRRQYRRCSDVTSRNKRIQARKRARKPYEVPWRLTQSFQESDLLSRCDIPESKSNTSSPVKSFLEESLPRSRSLDNLDFSSIFISDSKDKLEMENVSKCMKNLNMADL